MRSAAPSRRRPAPTLGRVEGLLAPWLGVPAIPEASVRRRAQAALSEAEAHVAVLEVPPAAWGALERFLSAGGGLPTPPGAPPGEPRLVWAGEGAHALPRDPRAGPGGEPCLVPARPRAETEAALAAWAREAFLPAEALTAGPEALAARAALAASTLALGRAALEPLIRAAEVRRAAWLKPRLVLAADVCHPLERFDASLHPELLAEPALRAAWTALGEAPPDEPGAARDWLASRPCLPVDTALVASRLRARLREALGARLDEVNGLFLVGENAGALALVARRLTGQVRLAYLDPPFNTACERRAYRDAFTRGTWLTFMDERLRRLVPLLCEDGTVYAHIDGHEKERLRLLLDRHLHHVGEIVWRIGWCSGFKTRARKFLRNHDTIYHYGRGPRPLFLKRYLPYPPGYRRRDGKPPRGEGYPLEDTWNCSPLDRLDSIQIVSFSREKVGNGLLTQKPEALLLRMLEASSHPGDWVLDPFSGSGTTCAAAHKSGRRWVGIEWAPPALEASLPRLRRVIAGERYGISRQMAWKGGGAFAHVRLEPLEATFAALDAPPQHGLAWSLEEDRLLLRWEGVTDPEDCHLATADGPGPRVDLAESLAWLLGLTGREVRRVGPLRALLGVDPAGEPVVSLWGPASLDLASWEAAMDRTCGAPRGRLFVWGGRVAAALAERRPGWTCQAVQTALEELLQPA